MNDPEHEVLYQIGLGHENLRIIAAASSLDKRKTASIVSKLDRKGLLESQEPPRLSSNGLLNYQNG